ncbi:MAG: lactate dehydrogenase [Sphingobacteriales bacterium]|nr:lactate dehydrogenase [Sphingobacteriales bacterium]
MKAVVYSTQTFEKELLARANQKKHDITLISNPLNIDTACFAEGKDAVIVSPSDDLSASVIQKLADLGIKFINCRTFETQHIDKSAAKSAGLKVAQVISLIPEEIAQQIIENLDHWKSPKCAGKQYACKDAYHKKD